MRHPDDGLSISTRYWNYLRYKNCFVGSEAVEWIVNKFSFSRADAILVGQRLMDAGIIQHVTHSEPFSDANYFYRFQEDEKSCVLNMKRIWDPNIHTRDALEVSRSLITSLALLCEEHRKTVPNPTNSPLASHPSLSHTPRLSQNGTNGTDQSPLLGRSYSNSHLLLPPAYSPRLSSSASASRLSYSSPSSTPSVPNLIDADDVDFSSLSRGENFQKYELASTELQRVQLDSLTPDDRIAFFVNIYNALCLHAHAEYSESGLLKYIFGRLVFFRRPSYRIAGLDFTLDDIEHGILRGNKRPPLFGFFQQFRPSDPKCHHILTRRDCRIHFLISAGTCSDPSMRILDSENIQGELRESTLEFLSCSVKVDVDNRTVTLPKIFKWYADDFPSPEKNLLSWIAGHLPVELSHKLNALLDSPSTLPVLLYENFEWAKSQARFNAAIVRRKRKKHVPDVIDLEGIQDVAGADATIFQSDLVSGLIAMAEDVISPTPFASNTSRTADTAVPTERSKRIKFTTMQPQEEVVSEKEMWDESYQNTSRKSNDGACINNESNVSLQKSYNEAYTTNGADNAEQDLRNKVHSNVTADAMEPASNVASCNNTIEGNSKERLYDEVHANIVSSSNASVRPRVNADSTPSDSVAGG